MRRLMIECLSMHRDSYQRVSSQPQLDIFASLYLKCGVVILLASYYLVFWWMNCHWALSLLHGSRPLPLECGGNLLLAHLIRLPYVYTKLYAQGEACKITIGHGYTTLSCQNGLPVHSIVHRSWVGCLESVEWNSGMEWWNGILEWQMAHIIIILRTYNKFCAL